MQKLIKLGEIAGLSFVVQEMQDNNDRLSSDQIF